MLPLLSPTLPRQLTSPLYYTMKTDGRMIEAFLHHSVFVSVDALTANFLHRHGRRTMQNISVVPKLELTDCGRLQHLEKFPHYVARQMGFDDISQCPRLVKLADDFLVNKKKVFEENMFDLFAHDDESENLCMKLFQELNNCLMSYFAFHWPHTPLVITQVLSSEEEPKRKLRNLVMDATRKQRFARITKQLKVKRLFSTLMEEMKAIGVTPPESNSANVTVTSVQKERSPVLLLMGGGMGAGKSTVMQDILQEDFWAEAKKNAVIIEADAFKESDVIYQAISSMGHHNDMLQTAELVHQSSTDAASSLLVTALNEGRDVVMDGTLSWEPFVQQTIAMARNIHRRRYRMGVGYKVGDDGTITESYWEPVEGDDVSSNVENGCNSRKPYRIELVGVVCDAYLAVIRGIRRAITTGRAVRVKSQLKSHQRFADAFPRYCNLVDNARLYSTNSMGSYKLIGWKEGNGSLLVEAQEISCLEKLKQLNENASSVYELYPHGDTNCGSRSIWNDHVMCPTRIENQRELKEAIRVIESSAS